MRNIVLSNSTFKVIIMNLISYYMIYYCCQEFTNSSCFLLLLLLCQTEIISLWNCGVFLFSNLKRFLSKHSVRFLILSFDRISCKQFLHVIKPLSDGRYNKFTIVIHLLVFVCFFFVFLNDFTFFF